LVRAQEKLVHHHEIHMMNDQLEEQLREIESLNISLEERIEEIEDANHKIAAFAEKQQQDYLSTIQSLVSAIEASDSYTRGHSERVTHFSLLLARSLDLTADRLCIMERAAILHDIGKIGINFAILNKRGTLSPSETHHLREHPAIGMKILEPMDFLYDVRTCIGQHHERYDGQGYPNRLTDDALLLESRILSIADAFDAMTSDRPYRKAMTVPDAIQELYSNAGTQFDPDLVHRFALELAKAGIWVEPGFPPSDFPDCIPLST
jgi:putative nucleotidyltransferase with HDIG domain